MTITEILEQAKKLSQSERDQLLEELRAMQGKKKLSTRRRLSELRGLGKEIWQGIDAQDYVNQMRDEWDERP